MNTGFSHALTIQGRVIWALTLREVQTVHGHTSIGYLWEILKSAFGIGVFWGIRSITGFHTTSGMHVLLFLVLGFIPLNIFSDIVNRGMRAVSGNFNLLTFPHVSPLDLSISSTLVPFVTQVTMMALFMGGMALAEIEVTLVDPISFGFGLIGLLFFSLGLSLTLAALNLYVPLIKEVLPMILRISFFCSGVFYSPVEMSRLAGDWIMWNPLANFIELFRCAFTSPMPSEYVKVDFLIIVTPVFLALGLLLERYTRKKVMAE